MGAASLTGLDYRAILPLTCSSPAVLFKRPAAKMNRGPARTLKSDFIQQAVARVKKRKQCVC